MEKKCTVIEGSNVLWGNSFTNEWPQVEYGCMVIIGSDKSVYTVDHFERKKVTGDFKSNNVLNQIKEKRQEIILNGEYIDVLNEGDEVTFNWGEFSVTRIISGLIKVPSGLVCKINYPLKENGDTGEIAEKIEGTISLEKNSILLQETLVGGTKKSVEYIFVPNYTPHLKIPILDFQNNKYRSLYIDFITKIDEFAGKLGHIQDVNTKNFLLKSDLEELIKTLNKKEDKQATEKEYFIPLIAGGNRIQRIARKDETVSDLQVFCSEGIGIVKISINKETFGMFPINNSDSKVVCKPIQLKRGDHLIFDVQKVEEKDIQDFCLSCSVI